MKRFGPPYCASALVAAFVTMAARSRRSRSTSSRTRWPAAERAPSKTIDLVKDAVRSAKIDGEFAGGKPAAPRIALHHFQRIHAIRLRVCQQEADEVEERSGAAQALRDRARRLYLRARTWAARIEAKYRSFETRCAKLKQAVLGSKRRMFRCIDRRCGGGDLGFKDNPDLIADYRLALLDRALELDEPFVGFHSFLVTYEMSRSEKPVIPPPGRRNTSTGDLQRTTGRPICHLR